MAFSLIAMVIFILVSAAIAIGCTIVANNRTKENVQKAQKVFPLIVFISLIGSVAAVTLRIHDR